MAFRRALLAALALFLVAGCGTESATTTDQQVAAAAKQESSDDSAPLPKARPKLAQPEAGVGAGQDEIDETAVAPGYKDTRLTDDEIRGALKKLDDFRDSLPDPSIFDSELLPPEAIRLIRGWHTAVSSVYYDYGKPIACSPKMLRRDQLGVAHKTIPCGTKVIFRYHGRAIEVPVIDRGPYIPGRTWDLTGATAVALRFNGLDKIDWKFAR